MISKSNIKICVLISISLLTLFAGGCAPGGVDPDPPRQALVTFFDYLADAEYLDAAQIYGGSYQVLAAVNPEIPVTDVVALWRSGCEINGFQCLPVRRATFETRKITGVYIFSVEFSNLDGSLFTLGACCGESPTEMPVQSRFEYRVLLSTGGQYKVLDLPVYVP